MSNVAGNIAFLAHGQRGKYKSTPFVLINFIYILKTIVAYIMNSSSIKYFIRRQANSNISSTLIVVRKLYKTILKLHRGLPPDLAYMGDMYVKDEFKRHKQATPEQTITFMESWAVSIEV